MKPELLILIIEAVAAYFLVLGAHAMRRRLGLGAFYALLGGLTAIMSWVTDAGVRVDLGVGGISFLVGSTVFYTALLLGMFVVYVFDGPQAARGAIWTVAALSILAPVTAWALHLQIHLGGMAGELGGALPGGLGGGAADGMNGGLGGEIARGLAGGMPAPPIPVPSLRINTASVLTTVADLFFLAMAWEILGRPGWRLPLWLRAYLTMLGVMLLDVLLFATAAFGGSPEYAEIIKGSLLTRCVVSLFAFPFLAAYLNWQNRLQGVAIESRPVLAILKENIQIREELGVAQREIARRIAAEQERERVIGELQRAMSEVKTLRGILPTCSNCKKIRDDSGAWHRIEHYIQERTQAEFSHGICEECAQQLYGEYLKPKS